MPAHYEVRESLSKELYFVLIASNGEIVALSEMYDSRANAGRGIRAAIRASLEAAAGVILDENKERDEEDGE